MEQPVRYTSPQEPLDDEERELMEPDTWDWDHPVELSVAKNPGAVLPIRFAREEIVRIEDVARAEGLTPHEFIKRAALEATKAALR